MAADHVAEGLDPMSLRIIGRTEWGARHGRGSDVSSRLPWGEVVIHTEAGAVRDEDWPEITEAARLMSLAEQQHVQAVERYHAVTLGWSGIGYSFLISRDGSIFEGRGWGRSGAHTETRNSTAAGVCFLGHGDLQPATEAQWAAARWLIAEGIRLGHLTSAPRITGHRNYSRKGKTCPGTLIYPSIQRLAGITSHVDQEGHITMAEAAEIRAEMKQANDAQNAIVGRLGDLVTEAKAENARQNKAMVEALAGIYGRLSALELIVVGESSRG